MLNLIKDSIVRDLKSKANWGAINWFKCASLKDKCMFIVISLVCYVLIVCGFIGILNLIYCFT